MYKFFVLRNEVVGDGAKLSRDAWLPAPCRDAGVDAGRVGKHARRGVVVVRDEFAAVAAVVQRELQSSQLQAHRAALRRRSSLRSP